MKRVYKETGDRDRVKAEAPDGSSYEIDFSKGIVLAGDKEASLSKNELQILKLLFKKRGEIVPRDDIMDYLWDNREFVDDNTLTVNISRIKSKLEGIGIKDVLITKRGMGYLLK